MRSITVFPIYLRIYSTQCENYSYCDHFFHTIKSIQNIFDNCLAQSFK